MRPVEEHEAGAPNESDVEDLSDEEIKKAIRRLKNYKAAGVDGIVGELLKYGGEILTGKLIEYFKTVWREEAMPDDWKVGVYVPLHKKEDRTKCENYRGLCLLNIGYKVLTKIMCDRLIPWYLGAIGDYQAGFVPRKSTIDNIFIIRQINEKYHEYAKTSWHIFVDYKQAYDSVHRPSLWKILKSFDVPEKIIRLIKMTYDGSRGRVRIGGELTDEFDVRTGLRQGCPLSCMLFNMALEWVIRNTPPQPDPVTFTNGTSVDRLAYADDCDLMGEEFVERDHQLEDFNGAGVRVGLEVKESKTKAMKMSRSPRTEDFIDLGGFMLEEVDSFRYLGSIISTTSNIQAEIEMRIASAAKCSWGVNDILKSKFISRTTKLHVYVSIIRPVATYACETWALTKELERRLTVFENSILRCIYGPVRDKEIVQARKRYRVLFA